MLKMESIRSMNVLEILVMLAVVLMLLVEVMQGYEPSELVFKYQRSVQETVIDFKLPMQQVLVPVSGGGVIWLWIIQSRRKRRKNRNRPS